MDDRVLIIASVVVACIGLVLLWFVKPVAEEQFVLRGVVTEQHGRTAIVTANVTVVGKNLSKGKTIEKAVFWDGVRFVMIN